MLFHSTLLLVLGATGPLETKEPTIHRDLAYTEPGHKLRTLDLYASASGKNLPIILWIHGGGWQSGDKSQVDRKPAAFTARGYLFVSVNYRLLYDATIKDMAGDVARAIRWVRDRAKEYGGDPDRIIVTGHSAGAQLAALVSTDDRYLNAEKVPLSAIKCCVPVDGDTYDVPMQIAAVEERRANIYRKKFGAPDSQKDLSPVTHIRKGKSIPPFLVLHVADHPETKAQSERLVSALKAAGIPAAAFAARGKTHTTINSELGIDADRPTEAMLGFLDRTLKK